MRRQKQHRKPIGKLNGANEQPIPGPSARSRQAAWPSEAIGSNRGIGESARSLRAKGTGQHQEGVTIDRERAIKGLGEAAIRVKDLSGMTKFYEEIVGLELLRQEEDFVFFRIAAGYAGHSQNLALFDAAETTFLDNKSAELSPAHTTLHHIAFNIAVEDFGSEKERLEASGIRVHEAEHAWVHVRSLYFADPEGNALEFVAYDDSLG